MKWIKVKQPLKHGSQVSIAWVFKVGVLVIGGVIGTHQHSKSEE